ncbi:hypothetical protein ABW21_db0204803 [Orbilia brochopaga]|nr:hypothetical protein ABW21_db0204803 [Drechslerella brochopaga]
MRYFEDLESVRYWRPDRSREQEASDRANVPLQKRPTDHNKLNDQFKLMVCHDLKGAYLQYEDNQGIQSTETVYTLEYLHLVSTFIYFSHHRVTIPPASWINLMHKNGIPVLGVLLLEPGNDKDMKDVLEYEPNGRYVFPRILGELAEYYGFDGWLLNFEATFPVEKWWNPDEMVKFIEQLKFECEYRVEGAEVIWYDSLTIMNRVEYVNGLSPLNAPFFEASSGLFTNYRWRLGHLLETEALSLALRRNHDVYMGIDVFGRGTFGGGGWGVGKALAAVRERQLSAVLFAPGWTFENFDGLKFAQRNRKFWIDGEAADPELICRPVIEFVPAWAMGSEKFFYTNFNRGYGKKWFQSGREVSSEPWIHVGAQSILPTFYPEKTDRLVWSLDDQLAYDGGHSLKIVKSRAVNSGSNVLVRPLYRLHLAYPHNMQLSFSYMLNAAHKGRVAIYFLLENYLGVTERHEVGLSVQEEGWRTETVILDVGKTHEEIFGMKLVQFGVVYIDSNQPGSDEIVLRDQTVLCLGHVCFSAYPEQKLPGIGKVQSLSLSSGKRRLNWSLDYTGFTPQECQQEGVKSKITYEFAYFLVYRGLGQFLGIAHCLEFLAAPDVEDGTFRVDGVAFDGRVVKGGWY